MSNEETKDCTRLPVVAHRYKVAYEFGGEVMCWEPNGRKVLETFPLAYHADAQARLAEKNVRIAQLAAHVRGKNKARANALKEIERLNSELAFAEQGRMDALDAASDGKGGE